MTAGAPSPASNEQNLEDNRDGSNHNLSWNCGVEGPTDDPAIRALRARRMRNFLATLMLSQGVPMLTAGDELGRTQRGNNNAYCQDNEISWVDWHSVDEQLLGFTRALAAFRTRHRVFRRRRFFTGRPVKREAGTPIPDIAWFASDGRQMSEDDWDNHFGRAVMLFVNGEAISERGSHGERHVDDSFLLLFNAHDEPLEFAIPPQDYGEKWELVVATATGSGRETLSVPASGQLVVPDRSLVVLDRTV